MTSRIAIVFLLLIGLCGIAAVAGGPAANTVAQPAAALATAPAAFVACAAAPGELSLALAAAPAFTPAVQTATQPPLVLRAGCTGCSGTRCTSLHSCVLNGCC